MVPLPGTDGWGGDRERRACGPVTVKHRLIPTQAPVPSLPTTEGERVRLTLTISVAAVALLCALCVPVGEAAKGNQSWQWKYKVWMPTHWQNLAECESGSDPPNWKHNSGTYQGAFGFYHGSWDQYRYPNYPREAYLATPWQQWKVARRIAARFGLASPWGCWRGPHHAWVRNGLPEYGTYK